MNYKVSLFFYSNRMQRFIAWWAVMKPDDKVEAVLLSLIGLCFLGIVALLGFVVYMTFKTVL